MKTKHKDPNKESNPTANTHLSTLFTCLINNAFITAIKIPSIPNDELNHSLLNILINEWKKKKNFFSPSHLLMVNQLNIDHVNYCLYIWDK